MVQTVSRHEKQRSSSTILRCRSCGQGGLIPVLSLGETPLANALREPHQLEVVEPRWPLELVRCRGCTLLQITETVPPDQLFSDYAYFSSFSDTMVSHARRLAESLIASRELNGDSLVVEVASNDGYLLQWYQQVGVPVLGVEPAANIAEVARKEKHIDTLVDFFGARVAERLAAEGRHADVIHANNVFAHIDDINGVVAGFKSLLKPDGIVVIETPYAGDFISKNEFDTIYHEHLFYHSITALETLFKRHGLTIVDVERLSIHGGSVRVTAAHTENAQREPGVSQIIEQERSWVDCDEHYIGFSRRVVALKQSLLDCLDDLKRQGKTIAAYGASAKGSTLLNFFGINESTLDFIVDRSTVKQGKYAPGIALPILPVEELTRRQPDYCLLLTWNFADEILRQQSTYRDAGGKFIVPIPDVEIL